MSCSQRVSRLSFLIACTRQVKIAIMAEDCRGRSIIAMAIDSGTIAMFEAVLAALEKQLRSDQVRCNNLTPEGERANV